MPWYCPAMKMVALGSLLPHSAEVENQWSYTSTPHIYAFMAWVGLTLPFLFVALHSRNTNDKYNA